jgi:hypothetical protein
LIDDLRSDPVAAQRAWGAANGPRANNNKTFFQIKPDAAANYLLKEINVNANLAASILDRWLSLVCDSWPHTENVFAEAGGWKPPFALYLLGGGLGIDPRLRPSADYLKTNAPADAEAAYSAQFADLCGKTLDLCVAKRILLRIQANVWRKFQEIDSKFKKSSIDFSSFEKADLSLSINFFLDALSVIRFVSDNKQRILDVVSFIDADFHKKLENLPNTNFMLSLFAGFAGLPRTIDASLGKLVLETVS